MIFWISAIVFINGIVSFVYSLQTTQETTKLWAVLVVNFLFYAGITQAGILFSAFMRISKSQWGRHFSKLGEILTLSFIPVAFITFIIIYVGGVDDLFYWSPENPAYAHIEYLSPWLGKGLFFWKNIIAMTLFYIISYIYFRIGRMEDRRPEGPHLTKKYDITKSINVFAVLVMFFYVLVNTFSAWDFGMMIIPHWESSIFPPYFWTGNILLGAASLFLVSIFFMPRPQDEGIYKEYLDSTGKLLIGLVLLWVYMFWSQYVVLWYGDLPARTAPLFKQMEGNYNHIFILMMLTIAVLPFLGLIFRRLKLSVVFLAVIAVLICVGVWLNRYLMVLPVFSDGSERVIMTWTNISLIFGGLAAMILSLIVFLKLFPGVKTVPE